MCEIALAASAMREAFVRERAEPMHPWQNASRCETINVRSRRVFSEAIFVCDDSRAPDARNSARKISVGFASDSIRRLRPEAAGAASATDLVSALAFGRKAP